MSSINLFFKIHSKALEYIETTLSSCSWKEWYFSPFLNTSVIFAGLQLKILAPRPVISYTSSQNSEVFRPPPAWILFSSDFMSGWRCPYLHSHQRSNCCPCSHQHTSYWKQKLSICLVLGSDLSRFLLFGPPYSLQSRCTLVPPSLKHGYTRAF